MNIRLERATLPAAKAILMFQEAAESRTYHPMQLPKIEAAIRDDHTYLVVKEDHMVVGFLIYQLKTDHVFLDEFVIGEDYRNQGFGSAALQAMLERVSGQPVELLTHPENPASHLYARHGFRWIETIKNYYGDGEPRMRMRRSS